MLGVDLLDNYLLYLVEGLLHLVEVALPLFGSRVRLVLVLEKRLLQYLLLLAQLFHLIYSEPTSRNRTYEACSSTLVGEARSSTLVGEARSSTLVGEARLLGRDAIPLSLSLRMQTESQGREGRRRAEERRAETPKLRSQISGWLRTSWCYRRRWAPATRFPFRSGLPLSFT